MKNFIVLEKGAPWPVSPGKIVGISHIPERQIDFSNLVRKGIADFIHLHDAPPSTLVIGNEAHFMMNIDPAIHHPALIESEFFMNMKLEYSREVGIELR